MSGSTDIYLVKTLGGLAPIDDIAKEVLASYGSGEVIRARTYRARNPRHHRLFFGLLKLVFDNQQRYLSTEALRFALTIQAGYVEEIRLKGDAVALKPRSISFASMDQNEFNAFYKAIKAAIPELMPELGKVDWERELLTSGAA
jgi:hypothetical protein